MLRGGQTLLIGWAVALIVLPLLYVYLRIAEKKGDNGGPYVDGKPTRKSNIILAIFMVIVVIMLIITALSTQV